MSLVAFDSLPDESRLWCFGASRAPGGAETAHILDSVHAFVGDWTAHSRELTAAIRWRDQRFLLVGLDEARAGASGCSIDVLTRHVNQIESRLEIRLLDATPVWYRDAAGRVRSCSREEFR